MLVASRELHHLSYLGLSDLKSEYADHRDALLVHGKHEFERLGMTHAENTLQHVHDEFHWGEIIVEKEDFIQRWTLGPDFLLDQYPRVSVVATTLFLITVREFCHTRTLRKWTLPF